MSNFGLREYNTAAQRAFNGNGNFSITGLTAAGTPTATAVFKTANAVSYMIGGRFAPSKAATDNIAMSGVGPNGLPVYAQPPGSTVYYPVLIDFAGNISTMQGDVNGAIPTATMLAPASGTITGIAIASNVVQSLKLPTTPGATAALTPVGSYSTVTLTCAGHGLQTGDTIQLNGLLNSSINGQTFNVTVLSSSQFTLDNCDPGMVGSSAGVGAGSSFVQLDAGRACIGVIKIQTGSAAFTPNTTTLAAGIAGGGAVTWLEVSQIPLNGRP